MHIVTWNIRSGHRSDPETGEIVRPSTTQHVIEYLRSLQADVVTLQEVDRRTARSSGIDQCAEIAAGLGMVGTFAANYAYDGGDYGVATFTRHQPMRVHHELFDTPSGWEPRGFLATTIGEEAGDITIINTHLQVDKASSAAEQREASARRLLDFAANLPEPVIICGDFNAPPSDASIAPMHDLVDTVALSSEPDETFAASPLGPATIRIDYIFTSPSVQIQSVKVDRQHPLTTLSDHFPVIAVISMDIGGAATIDQLPAEQTDGDLL